MKIKTWNAHNINDTTNYESVLTDSFYGLSPIDIKTTPRIGRPPLVGGIERKERMLYFDIYIRAIASRATLQSQLAEWFDPDDETPKKLLVEDAAGGGDRYVYAICKGLQEVAFSAGMHYIVSLQVHGDVLWRENTATTDTWSITASGQTKVLANSGKAEAYPTLQIKPTSAKTGGYAYKVYIPVRWRVTDRGYTRYPVDIVNNGWDTATLVGASKMQADGDDVRVYVDGVEVERWLQDMNNATTQVWINLDFRPANAATIEANIASSGAVATIDVNESIDSFPSQGVLIIGSEAFVYTAKNNGLKRFTGVTRASKGTSMAAHTAGDAIWENQHDVYIMYGSAGAAAPTQYDNYKPIFALTSTNVHWEYTSFLETNIYSSPLTRPIDRSGAWRTQAQVGAPTFYGGALGTTANPYVVMGIKCTPGVTTPDVRGRFYMYNPVGVTELDVQSYYDYSGDLNIGWSCFIESFDDTGTWTSEYTIAEPGAEDTWSASLSQTETLTAGALGAGIRLMASGYNKGADSLYVEVNTVHASLDSTYTPVIEIGAEQGNYNLNATITNTTTGDIIDIDFEMVLNQELEINTDDKTVTYLHDNSNQFQALTITGTPRRDWLPLAVGNNTIQFDDTGTAAVTIDFDWDERHYH